MWSLGCVLSEAATWIVLGRTGVRQYILLRQRAVESALARALDQGAKLDKAPYKHVYKKDCFHDGHRLLPEITEWHTFLRSVLRPTDMMTRKVLDLIDKQLFMDASTRSDAKKVCKWWSDQRTAPNSSIVLMPGVPVSKAISSVLEYAAEGEAAEISEHLQDLNSNDRRAAKTSQSFLQIPGANRPTSTLQPSRKLSVAEQSSTALGQRSLPQPAQNFPTSPPLLSKEILGGNKDYVGNGIARRSTHHPSLSSLNGLPVLPPDGSKTTVFDAYYQHRSETATEQHKPFYKRLSKPSKQVRDDKLVKAIVDRDLVSFTVLRVPWLTFADLPR
jgi:hypothetical protein